MGVDGGGLYGGVCGLKGARKKEWCFILVLKVGGEEGRCVEVRI